MVVTVAESQSEACMPCHRIYQCMVMVGLSLKQLRQFKRAEVLLKKAMHYAKTLIKAKLVKSADIYLEGMTEIGMLLFQYYMHKNLF